MMLTIFSYSVEVHFTRNNPDQYCGLNYRLTHGGDRIVGGREASVDEFPWMVSIQVLMLTPYRCTKTVGSIGTKMICLKQEWHHSCGGSLLNSRTILTAAHCNPAFDERTLDQRVVTGCHNASMQVNDTVSVCQVARFTGDEFIPFPDSFIGMPLIVRDDIAIIRLEKEQFKFMSQAFGAVGAVCLPHPDPQPAPGKMITTSGWGIMADPDNHDPALANLKKASPKLKSVDTRIQRQETCIRHLQNGLSNITVDPDSMFCAYSSSKNNGFCNGDSGGPAVLIHKGRYHVVGIVSLSDGCGKSYFYPDYYTRVDKFLPWINLIKDGVY